MIIILLGAIALRSAIWGICQQLYLHNDALLLALGLAIAISGFGSMIAHTLSP